MENQLEIFTSNEFGSIRTSLNKDGEPLFVAADVCRALDIANARDAVSRLDMDERDDVALTDTIGRKQAMTAITESGLYSLVLSSRKQGVNGFKRWITHEVIPSLRKNGAYATPETLEHLISNPDFAIQLLQKLKDEQDKRKELQAQNQEMKPKVLFADAVATSNTSILVGDLAKVLKGNGINVGQRRLFEWMRENGYLIKSGSSKNMPTQKSMDLGLMKVKEGSYINGNGDNITTKTTKITGKGQIYFVNKFMEEMEKTDDEQGI